MVNKTYEYAGAVLNFDIYIEHNWKSVTQAPNEKRALSNLAYRYKKDHNLSPQAKIVLPGKLTEKGE